MQGKVEICGVNTAKLKVLKSDEMKDLLVKTTTATRPPGML